MKGCCRREGSLIARWGGDEFIFVLPQTAKAEAESIMDEIERRFAQVKIKGISGSISLGCATKNRIHEGIFQTIDTAEVKMYEKKTIDRKRYNQDALQTIIKTLHQRFPREAEHAQRVSQLSVAIGKALHASPSELSRLKQAGFLHDLGKIVLSDTILTKSTALTDEERQKLKEHPVVGYRIANLAPQTMEGAEYILSHHENWDGTGYPKGVQGENIPREDRIIALAESYDRLINGTPYQQALAPGATLEEIKRNAGKKFDPEMVRVFLEMLNSDDAFINKGAR